MTPFVYPSDIRFSVGKDPITNRTIVSGKVEYNGKQYGDVVYVDDAEIAARGSLSMKEVVENILIRNINRAIEEAYPPMDGVTYL